MADFIADNAERFKLLTLMLLTADEFSKASKEKDDERAIAAMRAFGDTLDNYLTQYMRNWALSPN